MIARVFGVIAAATLFKSILRVTGSISTNTGLAPTPKITLEVATHEMGVVMTAIIMSGRTGAAFAALLGSMKANEEIDALRTFGFNPFDFLVLPRLLALVLMMPILTIYANIVGILGGMLVGYFVHIPPALYWTQTVNSVNLTAVSLGVFKSVFFGAAIAICGCMQGMRADNSSSGVGQATTRAVVAAITSVIVIDSIFAVIFTLLKI